MSEITFNSAGSDARKQHQTLIALVIIYVAIRFAIGVVRMHLRGVHLTYGLLRWLV
jgi:hypothetical protein